MILFLNIINSTFLNTIAVVAVGYFAYKIGRQQADIQDSIELYASLGVLQNITTKIESPIIHIQNVGTRVIYFDRYNFNGKIYELSGQVIPSSYANTINSFYRINLPANEERHVNLVVYFHDINKRRWSSKIICDLNDGWWDIKTYPVEVFKN